MDGEDFQEDAVLAAVKPLKSSTQYGNPRTSGGYETAASGGRQTIVEATASSHEDTAAHLDEHARNSVEHLFHQHNQKVFRTAYRVTGSAADAEDVLQTVFLRVARGQDTAAKAENSDAYFSRAAVNASLDLLRSRKRARAVAIDDLEDEASVASLAGARNPETHHEDRELRNLIREAVAKLGETAGQMFALRYFEGYGNGEIARMMNTSALVVGVTLHRARARLRKEIGRYLAAHK